MKIPFVKYQGTGNDFIMINDEHKSIESTLSQEHIARLCHRHFGIGADGLILLQKLEGYDFKMVYFNSDGKESTMCGNGGRCAAHFASTLGWVQARAHFLAIDGPHEAHIQLQEVQLGMKDVLELKAFDQFLVLHTGSPHLISWTKEVASCNVDIQGAAIRNQEEFVKEGINVNFVEIRDEHLLHVRTYERGVEAETLSCGTGVTAAAIAAHHLGKAHAPVSVQTPGGLLRVEFQFSEGAYRHVILSGAVEQVFNGEIVI